MQPVNRHQDSLNPSQRHRLRITYKHIDQLLGDIEQTLNVTASKGVFPNYIADITPSQREAIEDYIAQFRKHLRYVLASQGLVPEEPHISAAHSIEVGLTFIEVAIEELAPRYMRGYGPVSEQGAADLYAIMSELQSVSKNLHGYVQTLAQQAHQRSGTDNG